MGLPASAGLRFRVDPRDIPAAKVARRLGLSEVQFADLQERLYVRGFPRPDPDTGRFDLKAVEVWMDQRSSLTSVSDPRHASLDQRAALHAWTPEPSRHRRRGAA